MAGAASIVATILLATVLLAGCLEGGDSGLDPSMPDAAPGSDDLADAEPPMSVNAGLVSLDFAGELGQGVAICPYATGQCEDVMVRPSEQVTSVDLAPGALAGVSLRLTWDSESPITEELELWVGVWTPECDDCDFVDVGAEFGPSPVELNITGLSVELRNGTVLLVGVGGGFNHIMDPADVHVKPGQAFRIEGKARTA